MHSPIIYLLPDSEDFVKMYSDDEDVRANIPDESIIQDAISECDWLVADTSKYESWHRGRWDIEECLKGCGYGTVTLINENFIRFTLSKEDIINYFKEIVKMNEQFNNATRSYLDNNLLTPYHLDDFDYLKYRELHGDSFGGIQFVELEGDSCFSIDNLCGMIHTLHLIFSANKNKTLQDYIVPLNVQGDYHF